MERDWDIELVNKELKSRYDLDVINTTKPHTVEAYIWISILTLLISRRIYNIVRRHSPKEKDGSKYPVEMEYDFY